MPPRIEGLFWSEEAERHVEEHIDAWAIDELIEGRDLPISEHSRPSPEALARYRTHFRRHVHYRSPRGAKRWRSHAVAPSDRVALRAIRTRDVPPGTGAIGKKTRETTWVRRLAKGIQIR